MESGTIAIIALAVCSALLIVSWYVQLPSFSSSRLILPLLTRAKIAPNTSEDLEVNDDELILHYVRLYASRNKEKPLGFLDCLGLYSAITNLQPSVIYLHTTSPTPFPFDNCKTLLNVSIKWPPIRTFIVTLQFTMNGQYIREISHEADIRKLRAVEEYGGIVLDFDVFIINGSSLRHSLRSSECVICYEDQYFPEILVNGGLLGCHKKHARFPQAVLEESYEKSYVAGTDWLYNSGVVPWEILQRHNDTATVLDGPCNHGAGNWSRGRGSDNWRSLPAYHSYTHNDLATREQVLTWKNALGEIARWLLASSSNLS